MLGAPVQRLRALWNAGVLRGPSQEYADKFRAVTKTRKSRFGDGLWIIYEDSESSSNVNFALRSTSAPQASELS